VTTPGVGRRAAAFRLQSLRGAIMDSLKENKLMTIITLFTRIIVETKKMTVKRN